MAAELNCTGIYNVASGTKIKLIDVLLELNRMTGMWSPVIYEDWQEGDIKNFDVSNERIIGDLGMTWTSLQKGLTTTILDHKIKL